MTEILVGVCIALILGNLALTRKLSVNDLNHLQRELQELRDDFIAFRIQVLDYIFKSK